MLSRVGPGIFFALFGSAMIVYAVTKPIEIKDIAEKVQTADGGNTVRRDRSLTGIGDAIVGAPMTQARNYSIPRATVVARLNAVAAAAEETKTGSELLDLQIAVREAKLALMRDAWDPAWGDYDGFHRWVTERFAQGPPPAGLEVAVQIYRQGG